MTIDERTVRSHLIGKKGKSANTLRNKVERSLEKMNYKLTLEDMAVISQVVQVHYDRLNS